MMEVWGIPNMGKKNFLDYFKNTWKKIGTVDRKKKSNIWRENYTKSNSLAVIQQSNMTQNTKN